MQSSARSSQTLKDSVAELAELAQFADLLPEDAQTRFLQTHARALRGFEETAQRRENDAQILRFVRASLESLRSEVKYLLFDLEATRRENALLRKRLNSDS